MYIHRSNRLLVPFVLFISILILNYNIIIINGRILKKTTTLLRTNSAALPPKDPTKKDGASDESAEVAEDVTPEKADGKELEEKNFRSGAQDLENINHKSSLFVPGYKCRVCEDVVETFRDTNKCRGIDGIVDKTDDGEVGTPLASTDLRPCRTPGNCAQFKDPKQAVKCKSLTDSWRQDPGTIESIYLSVFNGNDALQTCQKLGQCRPPDQPDGAACESTLMSDACRDDIFCDTSKCKSDDCIVCYRLVKTWPIFGDVCTPGKNSLKSPKSKMTYEEYYGKYPRAGKSPELESDRDQRATPEGTALSIECYKLWDKIINWPRARYLITYVNELGSSMKERSGGTGWNANTVCKCLSLCPYNALQGAAVEQDCVADQPEMLTKFVTQALFPDLTPEKGDPTKLNQDLIVTKKDELEAAEWWKHR